MPTGADGAGAGAGAIAVAAITDICMYTRKVQRVAAWRADVPVPLPGVLHGPYHKHLYCYKEHLKSSTHKNSKGKPAGKVEQGNADSLNKSLACI